MRRSRILKDVKIEKIGYGGVGIATHSDGRKILVKGALPHTTVDCKVVKRRKEFITAHITEVKEVDTQILDGEVICPHYLFDYSNNADHAQQPVYKQGCGGCKRQAISYTSQLQMKYDIVADCFHHVFQEFGDVPVYPTVASPMQYKYRNKIEFSFGKFLKKHPRDAEKDGFEIAEHRTMGFHRQGQFSKVIDVDQCYLVSERMHQVFQRIKTDLRDSGLPVYDAKRHGGFLRHCVVREGVHTNQIMVILSLATDHLAENQKHKQLWDSILQTRKKDEELQELVTTMCIVENNGLADAVRSPGVNLWTVWGEGRIFEQVTVVDGVSSTFQISPFSFFQTNTHGAEKLFQEAFQHVGHVDGNVLDLYCGSGTIGLLALQYGLGKDVLGIEVVESAIYDAQINARINGLSERSEFVVGKAEKVLLQGDYQSFLVGGDLIIVDPPRSGLHENVIDFLRVLMQRYSGKLLYISCNPVTMARDISMLQKEGVCSLQHLTTVDLFPHTHHIETIGLLYY